MIISLVSMPKPYDLKNNPLNDNRVLKHVKDVLKDCDTDREIALKLHKKLLEESEARTVIIDEQGINVPANMQLKEMAVDCLKLAQTSRQSKVKLIQELLRREPKPTSEEGTNFFDGED